MTQAQASQLTTCSIIGAETYKRILTAPRCIHTAVKS